MPLRLATRLAHDVLLQVESTGVVYDVDVVSVALR
jgi:hypothetical protein